MSSLDKLINLFARFPSLGPKSARRIVLYLLKNKETLIPLLLDSIESVKSELSFCSKCGNIDLTDPCTICNDGKRSNRKVCVIEEIADLWAIEKSKAFNGHYHVLGGVLSAIDGVGPEDLNFISLLKKIEKGQFDEIIIATNATTEGQITGQYIADQCSKFNILITKLAQGMPIGAEIDHLDYNTMSAAFSLRAEIKNSS